MTLIEKDSIVVHRVALGESPLVVGEDDGRTDEELIEAVAERTETSDDLNFPDWAVLVAEPEAPGDERIRYVDTASRLNVKAVYRDTAIDMKYDYFEELADRIDIEGYDMGNAAMSAFPAEHIDDFEYDVHLDLTDE